MSEQISLKLSVPEDACATLMRQPLLKGAKSREQQQLTSIYYDTRKLALRKNDVMLRLRRRGNAWEQTVKRQTSSLAGLTRRPSWISPYLSHFDFTAVEDAEVRDMLQRLNQERKLSALFETNLRRTVWHLMWNQHTRILAMLDRGWIASSGRRAAVSELELELVSGDIDTLYLAADQLGQHVMLTPEYLSKAERGYRLFCNTPDRPVKAGRVIIPSHATPLTAFRQITLDCLTHLHLNQPGAATTDDPEYIHQMRVATRRLRAAVRMFGPVLPPWFAEQLIPPLRELMSVLGKTRDLDVLMSEIVAPVAEALIDEPRISNLTSVLTNRLFQARSDAAAAMRRPSYGSMLRLAAQLIHRPPFVEPPEAATVGTDLREFANRRLRRLAKRVHELAAHSSIDDPSSLHALRIGIKRLRYAMEFFAPMLDDRASRVLLARLAGLQERLGHLNDLASAGTLLMISAGHDQALREAVSLVGGWHGQRHVTLLEELPALIKKLVALKLPDLKK